MVKITEFKVEIDGIREKPGISTNNDEFLPLLAYSIQSDKLEEAQTGQSRQIKYSVPEGTVFIDQSKFITEDIVNAVDVWIYYRPSLDEPNYYDVLAVTQSKKPVLSILAGYVQVLYIAVPTALLVAGLFGYFLIRRLLGPLDRITRALQTVSNSKNDNPQNHQQSGQNELDRLASSINQALANLQDTIDHERQFASEVTHELRAPLALIGSEASLTLSRSRNKEEYQYSLENVSREVSYMSSIVNKLLFLSRIDHRKETLDLEDVDLGEILNDVLSITVPRREERVIQLNTSLADNVKIDGDEVRLRELFLNLVDNAIKYTPEGGEITVSLKVSDGNACVSIADTGIGIANEYLPHIFERFYRVPGVEPFSGSGSGLGLSICQEIAKLHGGIIEVESEVEVGSTFTVKLPYQNMKA
ncbi:MAG: HAMP domain-containing histidine kinase [Dehalococcoidales bacterium]|nr:HAMP domain-containing histidine kinase [Dehalococcoidales bacterium]